MLKLLLLCLIFESYQLHARTALFKPFKKAQKVNTVRDAKGDQRLYLKADEKINETFYWQHLSPNDGYEGTQSQRAYDELALAHPEEVIVAVIDSGVDIKHEALQGKIWVNTKEIPGNGIDDDQNGYIDDVNGWNFIGNSKGENIGHDTLEVTRELKRLLVLKKQRQSQGYDLSQQEQALLNEVQATVKEVLGEAKAELESAQSVKNDYLIFAQVILDRTSLTEISEETLETLQSEDAEVLQAKKELMSILFSYGSFETILEIIASYEIEVNYYYNVNYDPRSSVIGDNYLDVNDRFYGNNDVTGPNASHGTHVSAIIAGRRDDLNLPMKGIAQNVKIMPVRCVPDGDERDKDVANSIYYAVDNGAHIINMSFGKSYSPYKKMVDDAVAYAASKGVLLVHAAGNSHQNNDFGKNFPTDVSLSGVNYPNWIEVGASTWDSGVLISAPFSNYGKKQVDIFAPGFQIYSAVHDTEGGTHELYDKYNGTSMASPTVAGVAALVASQDKRLLKNAVALKELLLQSSRRYPLSEVVFPFSIRSSRYVHILENNLNALVYFRQNQIDFLTGFFSELSLTGGVVDAYSALSLIDQSSF